MEQNKIKEELDKEAVAKGMIYAEKHMKAFPDFSYAMVLANYSSGYIDGKMSSAPSGQIAGVQWVRGSDRQPGHDDTVHCKIDGIKRTGHFYEQNGQCLFYVQHPHAWSIPANQFSSILWFDESKSCPSSKEGSKERAIALSFAEWTAKGLWSTHEGKWYEYRNEDNPITDRQLFDLYLQSIKK